MNNDYDRENQLISAFAQLLEDTDDVVREFAEDLVKYAYYTSYDERGVNAFFHLVPIQYKIDNGYVSNIKEVLDQFKMVEMYLDIVLQLKLVMILNL